jgi:predicted metal-dependent phosphoesterase TrpH
MNSQKGTETASNTTQEIRQSISHQVTRMEAQTTAFDAQLHAETDEVRERLEDRKQKVEKAGQKLCQAMEQAGSQAEQAIDPLKAAFQQVQVQLALGWMEGREAYEEQKEKIASSLADFESEVDRAAATADQQAAERLNDLKRGFIAEVDALDGELTAAELQYVEEKEKAKAEWAQQKQAVENQLRQFKSDLESKSQLASDKLEKFGGELSEGFSQVKKAFTNLFS